MINKIILNNFQSHSDSVLELCQEVNVIVGKSDSGKSAILRAINWIVKNRPLGISFITKGTEESFVQIHTDQYVIERRRNKNINQYAVCSIDGPEDEPAEIYKAAGSNVPDPIKDILNFDNINIQGQIDQPFLLSNSPGEVASYFNSIIDLTKIDTMISNIDRKRKDAIKKSEFYLEEMIEKRNELKKFIDVNILESLIDEIEEKEKLIQDKVMAINRIELLAEQISEYEELIAQSVDTELIEINIKSIEDMMDIFSKKQNKLTLLNKIIKRIIDFDSKLIRSTNEIKKLETRLKKIMPEECPLCGNKIK